MSDNLYQQVQLQVSNAAAGQNIWVELQAQGSPVAWSTGPDFESSAGINIQVATGGALPLNTFFINASQVQVNTASSGSGSGALSFNITLYLVAKAGIQMFSLRSRSDPGISVLARIGNAQPQAVNQTFTPFYWNPQ
jgi:hypothetical protein